MQLKILRATAGIALLVAAASAAAAPQSDLADVAARYHYPGTLLLALVLAAIHLLAPAIGKVLDRHERVVGSFGSGMAIAYVFFHLLPELQKGQQELGRLIFVIALGSFIFYYGLEHQLRRSKLVERESVGTPTGFHLKSVHLWFYNWLIVYGTPEEASEVGVWRALPVLLALTLHLIHSDYAFRKEYTKPFDRMARYALATAPIAAWATVALTRRINETLDVVMVAVLAGTLMQSIFGEELPDSSQAKFGWFLLGAASFVAVAVLAGA